MGEAPELLAVALLLGPFLYTCVWGACQVQAGGPAALSEAAVIKLMVAVTVITVGHIWSVVIAEEIRRAKRKARINEASGLPNLLEVVLESAQEPSLVPNEDPAVGSPWSDPPPAGNGTPRAVDAALQPSEVPAKTDNAEVLPPLPAEIQPENSHANEDAAASLLASLGVTSASCPIFGAPLQQSSAAMPTMSDDEDLMLAPGAANLSDGPILGDYNVQPSSVSTGMQLVSGPDTITATQESKTHQPTGVTSKAKGLRRVSSAFEGLKIKAFRRTSSDTKPLKCTAESDEPTSRCWHWGAARRHTKKNAGLGRKLTPTKFGRGCFG